jgi:hypothetical protein
MMEDLNQFPGDPMPVVDNWYWVVAWPGDKGQRGMYTGGTGSQMPPFVDAHFRAVGLARCWWRELRPGE